MMRQSHSFPYAETEDLQLLELPYRGGETSMLILLPRAQDGIGGLEESLDLGRVTDLIDALERRSVSVSIPRLRFEAAFELSSALGRLGMADAFQLDHADFSGISKERRLALEAVFHKAFIAVDEEGTEAAAVTVATTLDAAAAMDKPVPFIADHPFVFLIRHRSSGAILFMGRVMDPTP